MVPDSPEQGGDTPGGTPQKPPGQGAGKKATRKKATRKAAKKSAKKTAAKKVAKKTAGKAATKRRTGGAGGAKGAASPSAAQSEPVSGPGSVTIVVVNWNGRDLLEDCLTAALAQDYRGPFEVVMVDNLSRDDSVAFVQKRFPGVRVIVNQENNYAGANNLGAASSASEFIVCLNTDARVAPDWLRHLVECAQTDPTIGAVTPLVLFEDGRVNSAGIVGLDGYHWADRGLGHTDPGQYQTGPVEGVSGCSAFYRRTCWDALGGLDTDFHMYYEDVDMSLRCRAAGWQLMLAADARVHHAYNASINKRDAEEGDGKRALKDDLGERNRLFVIARHFPEVLGEILPTSRFLLYGGAEELLPGLERILAKWERAGLSDLARDQVLAMVLAARATILDREAWARTASADVARAKEQVRHVRHTKETQALRHASERERIQGRVQALQARLANRDNELRTAQTRLKETNQRLQQQQKKAQAQLDRQRQELAALKQELAKARAAGGGPGGQRPAGPPSAPGGGTPGAGRQGKAAQGGRITGDGAAAGRPSPADR